MNEKPPRSVVASSRPASTSPSVGSPRYSAPALEKGLDILETLAEASDGHTLVEIAKCLGRGISEIFRMAVTLERRGYVQVDANDRYSLTLRLFELAHRQAPLRSLVTAAMPLLHELASVARQSCHLTLHEGGRLIVVAQVESPERWSFGLKVGATMGLTDTSSGHALLAFRDEVDRGRMLAARIKVDAEREIEPRELASILGEVRRCGYASMPSQQIRGVTNIAYPIFGQAGTAIAAINVPHIERIDEQVGPSVAEVRDLVGAIAGRLSSLMGYAEQGRARVV